MNYFNRENYKIFSIKQKNKVRLIEEPLPGLKKIQKDYLEKIKEYKWPDFIYGVGRSPLENSRVHQGNRVVISADINRFFPSTTLGHYLIALDKLNLSGPFKELIEYCFIYSKDRRTLYLPTGAPTSPMLAAISFLPVDKDIVQLAKDSALSYTRYIDDLTFSGTSYPKGFWKRLNTIVTDWRYNLNIDKGRLAFKDNHSQVVTGILVNSSPSPTKEYRNQLRAELDHYAREKKDLDPSILGKLRYLKQLMPEKYEVIINYYNKRKEIYAQVSEAD